MTLALSERPGWQRLGETLARELVVIDQATRAALLDAWNDINEAERNLDDRLVLGLIGGTGVGKSTLINALAREAISTSGDRRPTTDRVIVYRHETTTLPLRVPTKDVAEPQRVHRNEALERVLILDFPDFDSLETIHHEVLASFSSELDVLVLLVDDVKYGDERLFEVVRHLPQSRQNLHVVLNKVDALEARYPDRWREVADEILADLRAKLLKFANVDLAASRFLALSALLAFESRVAENSTGSPVPDHGFAAFEDLLETYREERRRRAAKELNLEARQLALLSGLEEQVSSPSRLARVESVLELIGSRREELGRTSKVLAANVLSPEERRTLASGPLRSNAHAFGFPIDFIITLTGTLRFWKRRRPRAAGSPAGSTVGLSMERLRRHFRPYLEGVENLVREVEIEIGEAATLERGETKDAAGLFLTPVSELGRRVSGWEEKLKKRWSIWNHCLPVMVLCGFVLSRIHPALESGLTQWVKEGSVPWGEVGKDLVLGLVTGLSPLYLLSALVAVLLAYGLTTVVVWTRQLQRLERIVRQAEDDAAQAVREAGEERVEGTAAQLRRWMEEREELLSCAEHVGVGEEATEGSRDVGVKGTQIAG